MGWVRGSRWLPASLPDSGHILARWMGQAGCEWDGVGMGGLRWGRVVWDGDGWPG